MLCSSGRTKTFLLIEDMPLEFTRDAGLVLLLISNLPLFLCVILHMDGRGGRNELRRNVLEEDKIKERKSINDKQERKNREEQDERGGKWERK